MIQDLNLLYSGGSGGFILLHLLLLSDEYTINFLQNRSIDEVIQLQWNIQDTNKWKTYEIHPNNQETYNIVSDKKKIYYFCNPNEMGFENRYGAANLCLYTDYDSQRLLAFYKKAFWYYEKDRPAFNLRISEFRTFLKTWRQHYDNIKDPSWPPFTRFKHIDRLPDCIKKELLDDPHTNYFLNYKCIENRGIYQGESVYLHMIPFIESSEFVIKLQDLINSTGKILVDLGLIQSINDRQKSLIRHWCGLHPPSLLRNIGITTI